jgi:quinol monooxygenase YgiN
MIHASVTIIARAEQRECLRRALRALLSPTRVEPGCLSCHLYEDVEQPDALTLVEEWATPADVDRRLRSDSYRQLLQLMESSQRPPEVLFRVIADTRGLEAVQEARLEANRQCHAAPLAQRAGADHSTINWTGAEP